ncbi:DUF397 domain-containing protein [Nocardiopsis sp. N85]|uniref:DUF397 domain-containing protein n=1 Tax=Nocardiopsis sp. N85 TaxID=3029400 RepID=UPI00237F1B7E|nr:DUF397 domain-containing protein [Nocardiopsis sp. N85]MDE3723040.1 DUF397 domain-containing protein [Nocardiopsis sp. N85]
MALTHDSRKSSYGNPSDCVEVAGLAGNTLVRDSRNHATGHLPSPSPERAVLLTTPSPERA